MLQTISRLENMAAARRKFTENGMMVGLISEYTRYTVSQTQPGDHGSFKSEGVSFLGTDTSIATSWLSHFSMDSFEDFDDSDCDASDTDTSSNTSDSDSNSELSDSDNIRDVVPVDDVAQDESLFEVKVSDQPGEYWLTVLPISCSQILCI